MGTSEKKYLKWYNKLGYGSGDLAANCIYAVVTSFIMIYLTDAIGMDPAVIGMLIMVSKCLDGVSDVFFGNLMDKTHTRMGKARPWMLWMEIGCCICLVALFSISPTWGHGVQYVYFFITYTLLNAVFFTANNIAFAALTSLITKNVNERVQMGSIRFMFALATNIFVAAATMGFVEKFGGGAVGWRTVAIIYAVIALVVNTISVFSVRELSEEELAEGMDEDASAIKEDKPSFIESFKLLIKNKYFIMIACFYIFTYVQTGIAGVGAYWCTYVLGDASMLGAFSAAQMVPMIIGLALTPTMIKKFKGMYKVNLFGYIFATVFRAGFIVAGYALNVPMMLVMSAIAGLFASPVTGDINALISATSEYTVRTQGKHIEGAMFSCSSLGVKVGGGIGTALCGILLKAGGYVANAAEQSASAVNMLNFMYLWFPMVSMVLITVIMYFLNVEKANADWDAEHGIK